jgi:hypothetical protein
LNYIHLLQEKLRKFKRSFYRKDILIRIILYMVKNNLSYKEIACGWGNISADRVFVVHLGPETKRFKSLPPQPALKQGRRFCAAIWGRCVSRMRRLSAADGKNSVC